MDSNIPSKPAYGVYISQLVRIGRICDNYKSFYTRHHLLTCFFFSKFGVSVRRHVEDGVCLPTVAINTLSNGVTTR